VKRQADTLVGAPAQADVSDPYIQEMASTALAEVDRRSNALYRQKVVRIVNAQKQVNFINLYLSCSNFYSDFGLWVVAPYSIIHGYQHFAGIYCCIFRVKVDVVRMWTYYIGR
jgi:hypothetical protein